MPTAQPTRQSSRRIGDLLPGLSSPAAGLGLLLVMLVMLVMLVSGCGYLVGSASRPEVRTIAVPVFTSDSDRRGLGLRLTEAVHKEIQRRLSYRIVTGPDADTRLTGRVLAAYKDVLSETADDDPRGLQLQLAVDVTWTDNRTNQVLARQKIADDEPGVRLMTHAEFSPEIGQSLATASQQVLDRMARRIVDLLESPW